MLEPLIRTKGLELHNILMIVDDSCVVELWPSEQSLFKCLILKKAWKQQENWVNCKVNAVSTINYRNVFPIAMGI